MPQSPARATRPNRTGVATRARILDAAIAILAEKGFAALTLQAVADRADVLFGSVTHHYRTRDRLVAAMIEGIFARYRARLGVLAEAVESNPDRPVPTLVERLVDDASDPKTASIFLELWAMATYMPAVATGVNALYDDAVDACVAACGRPPRARASRRLREALRVLATFAAGASVTSGNRERRDAAWRNVRRDARDLLVPFIEARLAETAAAPSRGRIRQRR